MKVKTKAYLMFFVCAAFAVTALLYGATQTETHTLAPGSMAASVKPAYRKVVIADSADGDANDFTETLVTIYGFLDRIVIDSAGTDTTYSVILQDDHGITLFTKTDCSSASEPYSYILTEADVDGNVFPGIPVGGACTLEIANIDDATATAITVTIYYTGYYQ